MQAMNLQWKRDVERESSGALDFKPFANLLDKAVELGFSTIISDYNLHCFLGSSNSMYLSESSKT